MHELPEDAEVYHTSSTFDEHSVPERLTQRHDTRAGVWARVRVLEGQARYRILEGEEPEEHTIEPGRPAVAAPEQLHQLVLIGPVRLELDFLRCPEAAPTGDENSP